jgi:hypothetical protein
MPLASSRPCALSWTNLPVSFPSSPLTEIASPPRVDPSQPVSPPPCHWQSLDLVRATAAISMKPCLPCLTWWAASLIVAGPLDGPG